MTLALILALVFGALLFLTSLLSYKVENGRQFDLFNEFPYELMNGKTRGAFISRLNFSLFLVTLLPWTFFQIQSARGSNTLTMLTMIIFLALIAFVALTVIISLTNPSNEKTQNYLFVGESATLVISSGMEGFYILKVASGGMTIFMGIVCFIIALVSLGILVNPKLKNWPKLDAVAETDGTVTYKRPRPFVLAISEWALIILAYLFALATSVSLLLEATL